MRRAMSAASTRSTRAARTSCSLVLTVWAIASRLSPLAAACDRSQKGKPMFGFRHVAIPVLIGTFAVGEGPVTHEPEYVHEGQLLRARTSGFLIRGGAHVHRPARTTIA